MLRFYMTAETQQAVIAESNRLIASRAALIAARRRPAADSAAEPGDSEWPATEGAGETPASGPGSTFARLVSDLQATSSSGFTLS